MNETKKALPIIFSIVGSLGTIGTAVLVAKETPKVQEKLKEKKDISKIEYLKILGKGYLPAILAGVATISSITASTIISKKTEASLIATTAVLSQGWNKYKYKIKDILGPQGEKKITDLISSDDYKEKKDTLAKEVNPRKQLYWEEHLGFFECDPVDFMSALNDLNQRLHSPDPDINGTFYWTSLKIFAEDAKAKVFNKKCLEGCKNIGWTSDYLLEAFGAQCVWVHPNYTKVIDKNTKELKYIKVDFWEEPIILQESETSRLHYKSRSDFEHEAESDEHSSYYIDEDIVKEKAECSLENDDLAHLIPSQQTDILEELYSDGTNPSAPEENNLRVALPDESTIPE